MDELRIVSDFTRPLVSKIVGMLLRKKTGCDINLHLNELKASVENDRAKVHLEIDADMKKEELLKLLKNFGLN